LLDVKWKYGKQINNTKKTKDISYNSFPLILLKTKIYSKTIFK